MNENKIAELFGNGKLSYDELLIKAGEVGMEIGDTAAVRGEYGAKLHNERCRHALEREIERSGAKNAGIIEKMIDMTSVTSDEDGVHGINEQITRLKTEAPYLFRDSLSKDSLYSDSEKRAVFSSGLPHGEAKTDPDSLDDYSYYKKIKKL